VSGSEQRHRNLVVTLRLSAEEGGLLRDRAQRAGLSVAGYLRQCALDAPPPRPPRRLSPDRRFGLLLLASLDRLHDALGRLGTVSPDGLELIEEARLSISDATTALDAILGIYVPDDEGAGLAEGEADQAREPAP